MRGRFWIFFAALIVAVALLFKQIPLLVIALLLLLSTGASALWNRYCLHRVEFFRSLSGRKVFYGEEVVYETQVINRKILPLPWLRIQDEIPEDLTLLRGEAESSTQRRAVIDVTSPIGIYHKITRRYPIRCLKRGVFAFGPTRMRSGDLFGLRRRETTCEQIAHLTVYPRLVPLEKLGIQSRQLFGDIRLKNHLLHDPVLTAGVREYRPGDSMKRIHWKSSARLGNLQTKVYEPTTTIDLSIFLDVRTVREPLWGVHTQLQELGIIAAASITRHALEWGFRVGFYANQPQSNSEAPVRVPHSRHTDQLIHILDALAQIHHWQTVPIHQFIQREAPSVPWGSTILVIAAEPSAELISTLRDLRRPGRTVALIKLGGEPETSGDTALPVYHIRDNIAWEVIDSIRIREQARDGVDPVGLDAAVCGVTGTGAGAAREESR